MAVNELFVVYVLANWVKSVVGCVTLFDVSALLVCEEIFVSSPPVGCGSVVDDGLPVVCVAVVSVRPFVSFESAVGSEPLVSCVTVNDV